jgi:hypothetical protein
MYQPSLIPHPEQTNRSSLPIKKAKGASRKSRIRSTIKTIQNITEKLFFVMGGLLLEQYGQLNPP